MNRAGIAVLVLLALPFLAGCGKGTLSCDVISTMNECLEYPSVTSAQNENVPVACSSDSGTLRMAQCPTAGFQGKCTVLPSAAVGMDGIEIRRFYNLAVADLAYQQSFCEGVPGGAWSTTF